jgi:glycerophosphoryl diester phosphodiesterase
MLLAQAPRIGTIYIYHGMLARSLEDGFNWAEALHAAGIRLDAWTLDTRRPRTVEHARRLRDAGVDILTTDTPAELAALLDGSA